MELMGAAIEGKVNETRERHMFHMRRQQEGESVIEFIRALKEIIQWCNYEDKMTIQKLQETMMKDQMVIGIRDPAVGKHLLQK